MHWPAVRHAVEIESKSAYYVLDSHNTLNERRSQPFETATFVLFITYISLCFALPWIIKK